MLSRIIEILEEIAPREVSENILVRFRQNKDIEAVRLFEEALKQEEPKKLRTLIELLDELNIYNSNFFITDEDLESERNRKCQEIARLLGEYLGNQDVIDVLVKVLDFIYYTEVREEAANSLKKIAINNQKAIDSLIGIVNPDVDTEGSYLALDVLGEIAIGDKKTIEVLMGLVKNSSYDNELRKKALETLIEITTGRVELQDTIISMYDYFIDDEDEIED